MLYLKPPWPIDRSTTELVQEIAADVDAAFRTIATTMQTVWPGAYCATREFWEEEVRFPAGAYAITKQGLVPLAWPEPEEEGDD